MRGRLQSSKIVTAATLLVGACGGGIGPSEEQLIAAELRWADVGITDYEMVITRTEGANVPLAVLVTVTNGLVSDQQFIDFNGDPIGPVPSSQAGDFPNVEGLFAIVRDGFDRAQQISVTFNTSFGYPETATINFDLVTFDDDLTIAVTQFVQAP